MTSFRLRSLPRIVAAASALAMFAAACGSDDAGSESATVESVTDVAASADVAVDEQPVDTAGAAETGAAVESETADASTDEGATSTFVAEVWADNWFSLSVNGILVGEDSVPITTERSFNAETISFEAAYPLTIALEAKDFKETDSGIEYIGAGNQQMGDGGIIVQITDTATGEVVAASDGSWSALAVHRAPLNVECEKSADPDTDCQFEIIETPAGWTAAAYDASAWSTATEWSEADVSPKDGYDEISWDVSAQLIWGTDLEVDNTVLLRATVTS
jgi:hypothetical protein